MNDPQLNPQQASTQSNGNSFAALLGKQEFDWRQGTPASIEELIASQEVQLTADQEMSLICNEVYLRESAGERPTLEEYQQRFIHLAKPLAIQWQLDHLLSPVDHVGISETPHSADSTPPIDGELVEQLSPSERYTMLSKIGSGGMGVVYRALDNRLNRAVAFKLLPGHLSEDSSAIIRFRREAELIAKINHPQIVPVYDSGDVAQGHYIAMELCEGGNLADYLRDGPLLPRVAAEIVRQTGLGIAAAHQVSVVHRDIKPGNILLTGRPESVELAPQVKVTDFGLAKQIDDAQGNSHSGGLIGTPAYLAPEQLSASTQTKLTLVDIYALGTILYECLTGRPPIRGANTLETLKLLATQEPVPIRTLQPLVPIDLATIAHKCLQRDPRDRYQKAEDVCDDLKRFLDGKTIKARRSSSFERLLRWTRREPLIAGLLSAVFTILALGFGVSFYYYRVASNNAELATSKAKEAKENSDRANQNFDYALETVQNYLTEVAGSPELKDSGLEILRRQLLVNAKVFYEKLQTQSVRGDSTKFSAASISNQNRLAQITKELGDDEETVRQYTLLLERAKSDSSGQNADLQERIGNAHTQRALARRKLTELDLADEDFRSSIETLTKNWEQHRSVGCGSLLMYTCANYADFLYSQSRAEEEQAAIDKANSVGEQVVQALDSLDRSNIQIFLSASEQVALSLQLHGQMEAAETWLLRSAKIATSRPEFDNDADLQNAAARANKSLCLIYSKLQRYAESLQCNQRANEYYEKLIKQHPLVAEYLDGHATNWLNLGAFQFQRGQLSDSEQALRKSESMQLELLARQPNSLDHKLRLAVSYSTLSQVLSLQKKVGDAQNCWRQGIQLLGDVLDARPNDINALQVSATLSNSLANSLRAESRFSDALPHYQEALQQFQILNREKKDVPHLIRYISGLQCNIARCHLSLKQFAQAVQPARDAIAGCEQYLANKPEALDFQELMATASGSLGQALLFDGQAISASESLLKSQDLLQKLIATAEDAVRFEAELAQVKNDLAYLAWLNNDIPRSLKEIAEAIDSQKKELEFASNKAPQRVPIDQIKLAEFLRFSAMLHLLDRQTELAWSECEEASRLNSDEQFQVNIKALMARIAAAQKDPTKAAQFARGLSGSKLLDGRGLLDLAAASCQLYPPSSVPQNSERERLILDLVDRACALDSTIRVAINAQPEFASRVSLKSWKKFDTSH